MKMVDFCCYQWPVGGKVLMRAHIKQRGVHTHALSHPKLNSSRHRRAPIHPDSRLAELRLRFSMLDRDLAACLSQSHSSHLKSHRLPQSPAVPRGKDTAQRESTPDHTCSCLALHWCLFVFVRWKNHYACQ